MEDRLAQAEKRLLQRQYELAVKKDLDDLEQKMGLKFDMALEEGDAGIYRGLVEVAGRKYGILEQENQSAKLIKAEHLQSREKGKEMQVEKQIGYRGYETLRGIQPEVMERIRERDRGMDIGGR